MGHILPPEPEYDDDEGCIACFLPFMTPKHAFVTFSGIDECWPNDPPGRPAPPESMTLNYNGTNSCSWSGHEGHYTCSYKCAVGGGAYLTLTYYAAWWNFFKSGACALCSTNFSNICVCNYSAWDYGVNGDGAVVFAPPVDSPSITKVANKIALPLTDRLRWDHWPTPDDKTVVKFCHTPDGTKIHVKFDPDIL